MADVPILEIGVLLIGIAAFIFALSRAIHQSQILLLHRILLEFHSRIQSVEATQRDNNADNASQHTLIWAMLGKLSSVEKETLQ